MLAWLPFLVYAYSAVWLRMHRSDLPERWVVHWNAQGQPNGWATPETPPVLLYVGLFLAVLMELSAHLRHPGLGDAPDEFRREFRSFGALAVRSVSLVASLGLGGLSVVLPFYPQWLTVFLTLWIGGLVLAIGGVVAGSIRLQRRLTQAHQPGPRGWRGLIYSNPEDRRLWVPKRIGVGWTLNFAHPAAWPILGLVLLLPIVVILQAVLHLR